MIIPLSSLTKHSGQASDSRGIVNSHCGHLIISGISAQQLEHLEVPSEIALLQEGQRNSLGPSSGNSSAGSASSSSNSRSSSSDVESSSGMESSSKEGISSSIDGNSSSISESTTSEVPFPPTTPRSQSSVSVEASASTESAASGSDVSEISSSRAFTSSPQMKHEAVPVGNSAPQPSQTILSSSETDSVS